MEIVAAENILVLRSVNLNNETTSILLQQYE